jgi:hypothetical protein
LLAAVGKAASHAGQTTLYLTPTHGKASIPQSLIGDIRAALQHARVCGAVQDDRPMMEPRTIQPPRCPAHGATAGFRSGLFQAGEDRVLQQHDGLAVLNLAAMIRSGQLAILNG